jgi:hypothetical protein
MDRLERLHAIFNAKSTTPVKNPLPRMHLNILEAGMLTPAAGVDLDASA